jgi:hypothetical protein
VFHEQKCRLSFSTARDQRFKTTKTNRLKVGGQSSDKEVKARASIRCPQRLIPSTACLLQLSDRRHYLLNYIITQLKRSKVGRSIDRELKKGINKKKIKNDRYGVLRAEIKICIVI